tara:strand:- start:68 stop:490 length:423 start_codon:yes stop_codon:yes gene_type:complete
MGKILVIIVVFFSVLSCKESNCVPVSLVAFKDLNESNIDHYIYNHDTFVLEIPSAVTPNKDGLNDVFTTITNITALDFVAVDFKIRNSCGETLHKQHGTFPFEIPDIESLEDGEYDFDFSIVLNDKHLITGGGVINVIRK